MGGGGNPTALDRREMLAQAVHFRDRGTAAKKLPVDVLFVVEGHAGRRRGHQRRAAAGDEAKDEVVLAELRNQTDQALRRFASGPVRHGMGGLDHLDPVAGQLVFVTGDDQALERTLPMVFDRPGHGARGLARTDHDDTAPGPRRQVIRDAQRRIGGSDRRLEQCLQMRGYVHLDLASYGLAALV